MLDLYYIMTNFDVLPPATEMAALSDQGRIIFQILFSGILGMPNPT